MTQKLDAILSALHSDKARLDFLESIYTPGNTEVADRILSMSEDSFLIRNEIEYAKKSGNKSRFKYMAIKFIDYHVEHNFDILLRDPVISWQDSELADYAIRRMSSKPEKNRGLEGPLEYAAEIAHAFGKKETEKKLFERLLALQERDSEYKSTAAGTLKKLGRFEEAIDKYLEAEREYDAFHLAKEHAPARVNEIAQIVFRKYKPDSESAELYAECADILGKTKEAEKILVKQARRVEIINSPRCYEDIVKSLVKIGQDNEARNLVARVTKYEDYVKNSGHCHDFDRTKELAKLYHTIGEIESVKKIYVERIKTRIKERHHPSNIFNEIERAIELTGDSRFKVKMLDAYEMEKDYLKAASLAGELGKTELAKTYTEMHEMIQAAKSKQA